MWEARNGCGRVGFEVALAAWRERKGIFSTTPAEAGVPLRCLALDRTWRALGPHGVWTPAFAGVVLGDRQLTTELTILGWSIILLFVHIALQSQMATSDRGIGWNAGPRDGTPAPLGRYAGRAQRASANFRETWPVYIALALGLALTGRSGGMAATGAWVWFLARVAYVPLYLFGVRYVRSLAYLVSMIGLVMMLIRFL